MVWNDMKTTSSIEKVIKCFKGGLWVFLHWHIKEVLQNCPKLSCQAMVGLQISMKFGGTHCVLETFNMWQRTFLDKIEENITLKYQKAHIFVNTIFRALWLLFMMLINSMSWTDLDSVDCSTFFGLDSQAIQYLGKPFWSTRTCSKTGFTPFTGGIEKHFSTFPPLWHTRAACSHGQMEC